MKAESECRWCHCKLNSSEARFLPKSFYWPTVIAAAFFHGGLWFQGDLSDPYCSAHLRKLIGIVVFFNLLIYSGVGLGVTLWLRWR